MYDLLQDISQRPEPFSRYTAKELWTRPHLARQMLQYHLNQDTELASRRFETIDRIVAWIDSMLGFHGKRVCDLGSGGFAVDEMFGDLTGQPILEDSDYIGVIARIP